MLTLDELLVKAKGSWDKMTPQEQAAMLREQAEGWVKSEAQWVKDFKEGKCERD